MPANDMTPSPALFDFVKDREGCELVGYADSKGVATNGIGHTGPEVVIGQAITLDQAKANFAKDIATAVRGVNIAVQVSLGQHEFDSLVDLAFNIGVHAFCGSTLLKRLNLNDFNGAHDEFAKWNKCGGRVLDGLTHRRELEAGMFQQDMNHA